MNLLTYLLMEPTIRNLEIANRERQGRASELREWSRLLVTFSMIGSPTVIARIELRRQAAMDAYLKLAGVA